MYGVPELDGHGIVSSCGFKYARARTPVLYLLPPAAALDTTCCSLDYVDIHFVLDGLTARPGLAHKTTAQGGDLLHD